MSLETEDWRNQVIVDLQHKIRKLEHECANWKAKYGMEKTLREREKNEKSRTS